MKNYLLPFALLITSAAQSQTITNTDLQEMIETERAFARMAKEQNTRDAFLFYMTDDVITSGPKGLTTGKDHIKNQKAGNGWLHWGVAFSDIAASGDLGYNTGPWEFRPSKGVDVTPVSFGEFNSIWKKQSDGSWKNALDIGISHGEGPTVESLKFSTSSIPSESAGTPIGSNDLMTVERDFLAMQATGAKAAYYKFLSKESRIVHAGLLPIINPEEKQKFLDEFERLSNVRLVSGGLASSNDLGYVYGTAEVQIAQSEKTETKIASYLRVWKKEKRRNWKIVLDVLSY